VALLSFLLGYWVLDIGYWLGAEEEYPITNKEFPISKAGVARSALLSFLLGYSLLGVGY
jgi:hypothetical protein